MTANQFKPLVDTYGDEIKKLYIEDKLTLKEIAPLYNVKYYIIGRVLKHLGVTLRNYSEVSSLNVEKYGTSRKYNLNENYFKTWTDDMAYILGFIYADGNVYNKKVREGYDKANYALTIGLSKVDERHLDIIKDKLDYDGNLRYYNVKSTYKEGVFHESVYLSISSKILVEDLMNLGVVPSKSEVMKFPEIPDEYLIPFIRGYFDGDGSIGIQYPKSKRAQTKTAQIRVRICSGSKEFLEVMQSKLTIFGLKNKNVISAKNRTLHEICYSTKESLMLFDLFYEKEDCIKLERKFEKFKESIETRIVDISNTSHGIKIK